MITPEQLARNPKNRLDIGRKQIDVRYLSPPERRRLRINAADGLAVFIQEEAGQECISVMSIPYSDLAPGEDNLVRLTGSGFSSAFYRQQSIREEERRMYNKLHEFLHPQEAAA